MASESIEAIYRVLDDQYAEEIEVTMTRDVKLNRRVEAARRKIHATQ
jgi:hypothetical protein